MGEELLRWVLVLMYWSPLFAAAICYGVFRRRIRRAGVDEDPAFSLFVRYLAPFCGVALGALVTVAFILDVLRGLGQIPRFLFWPIIYGPGALSAAALVGCAAWTRTPLGPRKDEPQGS